MSNISLKKNVGWMFIGNSYYALSQWIQLSLISKFCSIYILGSYTLALAITAPVFMFLGLQFRSLLVTDSQKEWMFKDYFTLRVVAMFIGLIIVLTYSIVNNLEIKIILLVALLKAIEGLSEIFNAKQQLHEQMKFVALSLVLKGTFAALAIFIGIYFFQSLILGLLIAIVSNLTVLFINDFKNCKLLITDEKGLIAINLTKQKQLFIKALPLGLVMCIISLNTNSSKYFVEFFLGTEKQGIYSTLAYCLVIGNFVNAAIGQSFSPRLSKYYANKDFLNFKKLGLKYLIVNCALGVILFGGSLIGGYYFLKIMFSEAVAQYYNLFSLIMFSSIIIYAVSALGYMLTSMRVFKIQPIVNGMVLIVNIICCYILINKYGLYGVVFSSLIAFCIQGLLLFLIIKRKLYEKKEGLTSSGYSK